MDWFTGIIVYLLVWWMVFFMALPFGVRQGTGGPETGMPGAPEDPKLKQKFLATTLISVLVWLLIYALISAELFSFFDLARNMHEQDLQP